MRIVRITVAVACLAAAACAGSGPAPDDPAAGAQEPEPGAGEPTPDFAEDPLDGAAEQPPAPQAGAAPLLFEEDPLAGAPMVLPAGAGGGARMEELASAPLGPEFDAARIDRSSELGLAVLRARFLAEELGRASRIELPEGPFRFGELVPLRFELRNPLGDPLELLPPSGGLVLELTWEVERWLPIGGHESIRRHRAFRLLDAVTLASDESHFLRSELPLVMDGDPGALWKVSVDARLRCAGARLGERDLPLHRIEYRSTWLHAFPAGWEQLRVQPLTALRKALASPDPQLDRHVLIATAMLTGGDRLRGLDLLLDSLLRPASSRRALTATTALQWLTRLPLGDYPADWIRWREERRLAARAGR